MPTLEPTCTCELGKGWGINVVSATNPELNKTVGLGERTDPKGRRLCQVHNAVTKEEWESRALGGLDKFNRAV